MLVQRTAVVLTAFGMMTAAMVGCHSPIPGVSPAPPGPGVESQSGGVNQQSVNGPAPKLPIPGVQPMPGVQSIPGGQPIPGVQPIPDMPTAPGGGDTSSEPIPGVPPAPPTAVAKSGDPIPGVRPEPMPPEILHPQDVTVPKDLTVPAVSSP
jgi:hypothetical protein